MLTPHAAAPGLLFGSFLYRIDLFQQEKFRQMWEASFGLAFAFYPEHNPLATYYSEEMGSKNLTRVFFLSTQTFSRDIFLTSKLQALTWEESYAIEGKRMVNIDTGMLTAENFTLATTKNYSHRVFVAQNIFSDLTYQFHQGQLQTFPWTYPDFQDPAKIEFFSWARSYLLTQLARGSVQS